MNFSLLMALIVLAGIWGQALAAKLDVRTHDMVIQKLEMAAPALKGQKNEAGVYIRLADLYADRARLKAIEEEEAGCRKDCGKSAKDDRELSIRYYKKAFPISDKAHQAKALLQMAHLHGLNGDIQSAKQVFDDVLKNSTRYSSDLVAEARAGKGEMLYRQGRFEEARVEIERALKENIQRRDFLQYRLAWSYLNTGRAPEAKKHLLKLLNDDQFQDAALKKDAARDLATFMARGEVTNATIDQLLKLSSDENKKSNLFYLGQECDRLGNKKGALLVWERYAAFNKLNPEESLEIYVRTAQSLWDQGQIEESLRYYEKFYERIHQVECEDQSICDELRARSRSYVQVWIKKEKTTPTRNLLRGLGVYAKNNPEDVEMSYWAGHIARQLQSHKLAALHYSVTADNAYQLIRSGGLSDEQKIQTTKIFEGALLAEIEAAEETQNFEARNAAYSHYLKMNPQGKKADEVKYQAAHLLYEKKQYRAAADAFHQLAMENKSLSSHLKVQAADLSLDSLAILKSHDELEEKAIRYADLIPAKKREYLSIARKSAVNQAVSLFNAKSSNDRNFEKALSKLSQAPLEGADDAEIINIHKNKIKIAEKLRNLDVVDQSADRILQIKNASKADKQFATERKLWVAEMRLDFSNAARLARMTPMPQLSADMRDLRVAVLTELSGRNAERLYRDYLKKSRDLRKSNFVRMRLVGIDKRPWSELKKHKAALSKTPDIYAMAILEAFAKTKNHAELKVYSKDKALARTSMAPVFKRFLTLDENKKLFASVSQHRIKSRTENQLKASLKERIRLLSKMDRATNAALRSGDFTLQVTTLNVAQKEYDRLYRDILSLPAPKGLNKKQKSEYLKLMAQQAAPYQQTSRKIQNEIEGLWKSSRGYRSLLVAAEKERGALREIITQELNILLPLAPRSEESNVRRALARASERPSQRDIERAREAIRQDPFDNRKIANLRDLESLRGSQAMVGYLEARLNDMRSEGQK